MHETLIGLAQCVVVGLVLAVSAGLVIRWVKNLYSLSWLIEWDEPSNNIREEDL